jgi:pimeloyl-ACP methyl ester carboxylesterase
MITLGVLGLILLPFLLIGGILALFWKQRRRAVVRWSGYLYVASVLAILLGVGPYLMAWAIVHAGTRGPDRKLHESPADYGLTSEDVIFESHDALRLGGWFVPPSRRNVVVIYTHGLFRNRREMLSRAAAACRAGYGALLYDSRSHGDSDKGIVSLGYYERNDVLGAMEYLRRRYQDAPDAPRIVLAGISMGAVATLEAAAETRGYSAIVVDSPFASLRETVVDHSWLFLRLPRYPFPALFMFWFERLAGFNAERVNVREAVERIQPVPILFIGSEGDVRIRSEVARSLYQSAHATVKRIEIFPKDVGHGAAARLYPERYARTLVGFLDSALGYGTVVNPTGAVSMSSASAGSPR